MTDDESKERYNQLVKAARQVQGDKGVMLASDYVSLHYLERRFYTFCETLGDPRTQDERRDELNQTNLTRYNILVYDEKYEGVRSTDPMVSGFVKTDTLLIEGGVTIEYDIPPYLRPALGPVAPAGVDEEREERVADACFVGGDVLLFPRDFYLFAKGEYVDVLGDYKLYIKSGVWTVINRTTLNAVARLDGVQWQCKESEGSDGWQPIPDLLCTGLVVTFTGELPVQWEAIEMQGVGFPPLFKSIDAVTFQGYDHPQYALVFEEEEWRVYEQESNKRVLRATGVRKGGHLEWFYPLGVGEVTPVLTPAPKIVCEGLS